MMADYIDLDAVVACADVVARTGATSFELGYLDENVPVEKARWYAQAMFRGARVIVDERHGPDEAADALARRLLDGGTCTNCGKEVGLSKGAACRWYRDRDSWVRGCDGKRHATKDRVRS